MLSNKLFRNSILIFLVCCIFGCASKLHMLSADRIDPSSTRLYSTKYKIVMVNTPTVSLPMVSFVVNKTESYKTQINTIHKEIKSVGQMHWAWILLVCATFPLTIWFVPMTLDYLRNYVSVPPQTEAGEHGDFPDLYWHAPTGKIVNGQQRDTITHTRSQLSGVWVKMNSFNISRNFVADSTGKVKIHLVKDLSLSSFDSDSAIFLELNNSEHEFIGSIEIQPKDWTVPYIQITKNETPLYTKQRTFPLQPKENKVQKKKLPAAIRSKTQWVQDDNLPKLSSGQDFKVIKAENGYCAINFAPGKEGWIPKSAGKLFWSIPERIDPNNPPSLEVSRVLFTEPSGEGYLDAEETGEISIELLNKGKGTAYRINVKLTDLNNAGSALTYDNAASVPALQPGQHITIQIPVSANLNVTTKNNHFGIEVTELNGFDADPVEIKFDTRAYRAPELVISEIKIDDANENGTIELGESVDLIVRLTNKGAGKANEVTTTVVVKGEGQNIFYQAPSKSFSTSKLNPGENMDIRFTVATNKRFLEKRLPVSIEIKESKYSNSKTIDLDLPLNVPVTATRQYVAAAREDEKNVAAPIPLNIDVETDIPFAKERNQNTFAVIIGIERYNRELQSVPFAKRDALWFREYAVKTLGVPDTKSNLYVITDNNAGKAEFLKLFSKDGWLSKRVDKNSVVHIYYAGHGAPEIKQRSPYLLPYDGDPNYPVQTGFSLQEMYDELAALDAKQTNVFLDACFSGGTREPGQMILADARPVDIEIDARQKALSKLNIFAAASGDQISSSYPEKSHGLFTYFLLKGIQGAADADNNKKITVGELESYLVANVSRTAGLLDRAQTPVIMADNKETVIAELK